MHYILNTNFLSSLSIEFVELFVTNCLSSLNVYFSANKLYESDLVKAFNLYKAHLSKYSVATKKSLLTLYSY